MPRKVSYGVDYDDDEYGDFDDYDDDDFEVEQTGQHGSKQEKRTSGLWRCSICTYDNEESLYACDICGVLRNPLLNIDSNGDKGSVNDIGKDSGVSVMAKSLFASMPHQAPKKPVVYQQQNDDFVTEEGNKLHKCGNVGGNFHEFHKAFSSAPFMFDVPSIDDLVSDGLNRSKTGSKASFLNSKSSAVSSGVAEKNGAVALQSNIKKSDKSSVVNRKDNVVGESSSTYGVVNKQSSEKSLDGSSLLVPKSKRDVLNDSNYSISGGEPHDLINNLSNVSLNNKSGKSNKVDPGKANSRVHYQPEKWMLLSKAQDDLTQLNLAIVGHVDSGKSTLSGRLLHLLGRITQKQMHKYEKDSQLQGKGSFAYAWALDESTEERERGITMTVAVAYFDTKTYHVVVLDSPGHKDFVPNMISGATQADAAILVIDASFGAFEAGMDGTKGQTREHAQLIRSFGIDQVIVAVNKMDAVDYSKERFDLIKLQLGAFLHSCNFKESSLTWMPLSAMENQNLVAAPSEVRLLSWYRGPCLLDAIDFLQPPSRDLSKPLLMPICDVIKLPTMGQVSACGKLEAGALRSGSKVLVMPSGIVGTVRSLERDSQVCGVARAGDNVAVSLQGIDGGHVMAGGVLCHPDFPVAVARHLELKILVLDVVTPILIGTQLEFHIHHAKDAARVTRILSLLDPKTGKARKKGPRCLLAKQNAIIEVILNEPVCVQEFSNCRALGRVSLRALGRTVALGIVTRIVEEQE
ncbi:HBS1-like protein isoform X2 [Tripterygium wilfordii]|uniref:HBS1-like protein isoform X2 n=1 Tax=Tripterygium wilfordii TaxID=458696 RepID=UPI0018F858E1|nr:HBS1-like protein isoform X2 [Tripterygium wilfordii]